MPKKGRPPALLRAFSRKTPRKPHLGVVLRILLLWILVTGALHEINIIGRAVLVIATDLREEATQLVTLSRLWWYELTSWRTVISQAASNDDRGRVRVRQVTKDEADHSRYCAEDVPSFVAASTNYANEATNVLHRQPQGHLSEDSD